MKRKYKRKYFKKRSKFKKKYWMLFFMVGISIIVMIKAVLFDFVEKKQEIKLEDIQRFPISGELIGKIKTISEEHQEDFLSMVTLILLEKGLFYNPKASVNLDEIKKYCKEGERQLKNRSKIKNYVEIRTIYSQALKDVKTFPIPRQALIVQQEEAVLKDAYDYEIEYIDSWGAARDYKKKAPHEGTDIMDKVNMRGRIPIISMTDGKIEKIGWNELGGWRIGIRTPSGAYFYYAHLAGYQKGLLQNRKIKAGELLGYMGDSGYSQKEGTVGKFPVHLHLGIAVKDKWKDKDFIWINPYPVLQYIEDSKRILEEL